MMTERYTAWMEMLAKRDQAVASIAMIAIMAAFFWLLFASEWSIVPAPYRRWLRWAALAAGASLNIILLFVR